MLRLYDTRTQSKRIFTPIQPGQVGLYLCGITAYDLCHLGHARTFTCFDVIVRYFEYLGFEVRFIRNITDIDDKIIHKAGQEQRSCDALVIDMVQEMYKDFDGLGLRRPTVEPYATAHIPEIIAFVQRLFEQSMAYTSAQGDILFPVKKFNAYGQLSKQSLEQLRAGQALFMDGKQDPADFVLWKLSKPGEPSWPSPWGEGRPGWHIECSAMSQKCLGANFDIHGGGGDLIFPHHENEIAQSVSANGVEFANYWLHTGMVVVDEEKMSKSLNNFLTVREITEQIDPESLRYFLLSAHYRSPIHYSEQNLRQARSGLVRLYSALLDTDAEAPPVQETVAAYENAFRTAMDDDCNTPEAYAVLFSLANALNRLKKKGSPEQHGLAASLRRLGRVLGLLQQDPQTFLQGIQRSAEETSEIERLIQQRNAARLTQDWETADRIRLALLTQGVKLEDAENVTRWRLDDHSF